jgi:hypothetical protein
MHPDNTVICQVKISRAAMKAAQEAAKAAKAPVKGKKNNIFHSSKASVVNWCFYLIYLASQDYFKLLLFQKHKHCLPTDLSAIHFNLLSAKRLSKGFSLLSGLFYNLLPQTLTLYSTL